MKVCKRNTYKTNAIVSQCFTGKYLKTLKNRATGKSKRYEYICHNCHQTVARGNMPAIATAKNLELQNIPVELQGLNILERHMMAKFIQFAKIINLPKAGQEGVHGPVISVRAEVSNTVQSLPRALDESRLLKVKLKRCLSYKGHYQCQSINPLKVLIAVKHLLENHSEYGDIVLKDNDPDQLCNAGQASDICNTTENSERFTNVLTEPQAEIASVCEVEPLLKMYT